MTGATVGLYDHFDLFLLSCTRDYHCWGSSLLALLSWRVDLSQATSARSDSCSYRRHKNIRTEFVFFHGNKQKQIVIYKCALMF